MICVMCNVSCKGITQDDQATHVSPALKKKKKKESMQGTMERKEKKKRACNIAT